MPYAFLPLLSFSIFVVKFPSKYLTSTKIPNSFENFIAYPLYICDFSPIRLTRGSTSTSKFRLFKPNSLCEFIRILCYFENFEFMCRVRVESVDGRGTETHPDLGAGLAKRGRGVLPTLSFVSDKMPGVRSRSPSYPRYTS